MRVAASALAVAAFVRLVDADLLLRAVARLAPRSAMIAALSSRMLPALERDAAGMVVAAGSRAARLNTPPRGRGLVGPLMATSLERSLSVAEAMEARGYGETGRTRALERRPSGPGAVGLSGAAAVAWSRRASPATGASDRVYDALGDPFIRPRSLARRRCAPGRTAAAMIRWSGEPRRGRVPVSRPRRPALDGVDLRVERRVVLLVGDSGSGKSTLLRARRSGSCPISTEVS